MLNTFKTFFKHFASRILEYPAHDAAFNGDLKSLKRWLNVVDIEEKFDKSTPLMWAISGHKLECIICLLEHNANPNSLSCFLDIEAPIAQICLKYFEPELLKLLTMYGIKKDKLVLPSHIEDEEKVKVELFDTIYLKKQKLDECVDKAEQFNQQLKYDEACIAYQEAGNIWLRLQKDEKEPIYDRHYQRKALQNFEKAAECHQHHLKAGIMTSAHYKIYEDCLEQVIKLCKQLNENQKISHYSALLSQLERNQEELTFSTSIQKALLH